MMAQSSIECRIDSVMAQMSIEDKIGQLNQLDGRSNIPYIEDLLRKGQLGSIMNITDPAEVDRLQRIAMEESPLHIPVVFTRDVVHGFRTMLPIPLGLAATFNEEAVKQGSRMAAEEATENGVRWGFGPMIDVSRDSRWGRIAESFGEDPFMNSRFAVAVVQGYQTSDLSSPSAMAACAKHFVGYGAVEGGRDYNTTYLTERQLRDTYLPPFRAAVDAGCASIMTSFNDNDGLPVSADPYLLHDVLREEWDFDGVTVSDWGAIAELVGHGIASDRKDAARYGLTCGTDMDMSSKVYMQHAGQLVEEGTVPMDNLDNAVRNVLRLKFRLGLFDRPYTGTPKTAVTGCREHLKLASDITAESIVLLKNDGILPLDRSVRTILVTGPMADAPHDQLGTWTMDGDTSMTVTPVRCLASIFGKKVKILYEPGLKFSRDRDTSSFDALRHKAAKADVILAFLGEEAILSGEAHCLSDISLQGAQSDLLKLLSGCGKPVVSIFMAGRPMTIAEEAEISDAVLYAWHPGTMGGEAIARILKGDVNPSGKLPVTFPLHVGQTPLYYSRKSTGRQIKRLTRLEDIPLNARQSVLGHSSYYLDTGIDPLYPFGYGLSYTTFEISDVTVEKDTLGTDGTIEIKATIKNTGKADGAEVVQVYVSDVQASVTRPVKELKAFRKVFLKSGESRDIRMEIPVSSLAFHDARMQKTVEPGKFILTVGNSSVTSSAQLPVTVSNSPQVL